MLHLGVLVEGVGVEAGLAQDGCVALVLEAQGEVLAARGDDAAVRQDVDVVGRDVVEQALVVRDEEHPEVGAELGVDALGDDAQGIDVEARVGLVEDGELGLQDGHLEHLEALLLAAREALVDVAAGERVVQPEERHLLAHERAELAHADAAPGGVRGVDARRRRRRGRGGGR